MSNAPRHARSDQRSGTGAPVRPLTTSCCSSKIVTLEPFEAAPGEDRGLSYRDEGLGPPADEETIPGDEDEGPEGEAAGEGEAEARAAGNPPPVSSAERENHYPTGHAKNRSWC